MTAGTSARANATGENQASWFSSTRAIVYTTSRTTYPPSATMLTSVGETVAAHAIDDALATKFAYTTAIAMAADHPAAAPPNSAATAKATIAAGTANGETRRISARSGSGAVTL